MVSNTCARSQLRQRFLTEYSLTLCISKAARRASVNRCTIYRWQSDPEFVASMKIAADAYFDDVRAKAVADETEQQKRLDARNLELRPKRLANLNRARAARWV